MVKSVRTELLAHKNRSPFQDRVGPGHSKKGDTEKVTKVNGIYMLTLGVYGWEMFDDDLTFLFDSIWDTKTQRNQPLPLI